jgi:hypothetical protein
LNTLFKNASRIIKYGYISELQRDHTIKSLDAVDGNYSSEDKHEAVELLHDVMESRHILSVLNSRHLDNDDIIRLFNKTLEIVYAETSSRAEAERMIARLYRVISEQLAAPSSHRARPGR